MGADWAFSKLLGSECLGVVVTSSRPPLKGSVNMALRIAAVGACCR
jgi:hypothetical protein